MLSSRNNDLIPAEGGSTALAQVRKDLQAALQNETFCGRQLLDVWINEEAGAADGTGDAWEQCMERVDEADLVVVIYNGHAGWSREPGGVGICHAEFQRAWSRFPSKLRLIGLRFGSDRKLKLRDPEELGKETETNRMFREELDRASLFQAFASDDRSLKEAVLLAVASGVTELVRMSAREGRKGKYYLGSPLNWSRLNYVQRKEEIERSVKAFLQGAKRAAPSGDVHVLEMDAERVILQVHGIPSGFGVAEARELVGRPYLRDCKTLGMSSARSPSGPVHLLACHKRCTESQVIKFMGHPDLFIVQAPFGYFVADPASFIQAFFLMDCRDDVSTRLACQRLFDWIEQAGEGSRIAARAGSRARILRAMAEEMSRNEKLSTQLPGTKESSVMPRRPVPRRGSGRKE
jgi:hypothetical protein